MRLYFAGPLFSEAELNYNKKLTDEIENLGFEVFLPQRDGNKVNQEPYLSMDVKERAKAIFELDKEFMLKSDIFLYILDGRVPDEGAAVALGMIYMHKSLVNNKMQLVGLQTDKRVAFKNEKLNPMIQSSLDIVVNDRESLITYLKERSIDLINNEVAYELL